MSVCQDLSSPLNLTLQVSEFCVCNDIAVKLVQVGDVEGSGQFLTMERCDLPTEFNGYLLVHTIHMYAVIASPQ